MADAPAEDTKAEDATAKNAATEQEKHSFQAEVGRLLDIVANALYSEREIFLRELISNAADACDRLRYQALSDDALLDGDADFSITLSADAEAKTLTITDNGSGMSRDELVGNLGTIARSGTSNFVNQLTGDAKKDVNLIGQFGVGFYSAFMVSKTVEVVSRRAGEATAHKWISDGKGEFTLEEVSRDTRGTSITLFLKEDAEEFLAETRLSHIVKTYSDHIAFPIRITGEGDDYPKQLNSAAALWTKSKSDITEEQYKEFYHHVGQAFDDPWETLHFRVEGVIEYSGLVFIPSQRPFDIFHPDRTSKLKLYVKRVFITDEADELIPSWLRFLRGVIDSEDLPLNVSREMLQNNPVVSKIRSGLVKRVIAELSKRADKDHEGYATFWDSFGPVLKEGVYESHEHRDALMKLVRFKSTTREGWVSLADYVEAMKEGQDAIYYITGENVETLSKSPQLEGFAAKGVEVLYLTDPVDEFWLSTVHEFDEKAFKSVTRGGADLNAVKKDESDESSGDDESPEAEGTDETILALITSLKEALGDKVADIRKSDRLTSSPCCLVAEDGAMDMHLERLLKQHNQFNAAASSPRVLEINPDHILIKALAKNSTGDLSDAAHLLLDQARIMEGETPVDAQDFVNRMAQVMTKAMQ